MCNRWLLLLLPIPLAGDIQTTSQQLNANIAPAGRLFVPGSVALSPTGTRFQGFAGNVTLSYWARTQSGAGGSVTLQAASQFAPKGGPAANSVTYTCTSATLGSACSGTQTLQVGIQTSVVTIPAGACTGGGGTCSNPTPNTVRLDFSAPSMPRYKTGAYSAQLTFTISTL